VHYFAATPYPKEAGFHRASEYDPGGLATTTSSVSFVKTTSLKTLANSRTLAILDAAMRSS